MRTPFPRLIVSILVVPLLLFAATMPAGADEPKPIAIDAEQVAIRGYDTVAYFTDGKATKGSSAYEYVWNDAKWRFASAAHRDMFIANPDHYAPQFGGFCAGAIVYGELVPANPENWVIVDDKLYMTAGTAEDFVEWKANAAQNIDQADEQWPVVQARWATQQ